MTVAQQLKLPKGSLVVMDRGDTDYYMYERWSAEGVGFVTRLKKNAEFYEFTDQPVKQGVWSSPIISDSSIALKRDVELKALTAKS